MHTYTLYTFPFTDTHTHGHIHVHRDMFTAVHMSSLLSSFGPLLVEAGVQESNHLLRADVAVAHSSVQRKELCSYFPVTSLFSLRSAAGWCCARASLLRRSLIHAGYDGKPVGGHGK